VDVRVIAATDRDLAAECAVGRFREDLLRRFELLRIVLPPLRERGPELAALAEHLLARLCKRHRLPVRSLSTDARARLAAHRWPGNVRELVHELERALVFGDAAALEFRELAPKAQTASVAAPSGAVALPVPDDWLDPGFKLAGDGKFHLEEAINRFILLALAQTSGNVTAAARLLGVTRDYLRYRLEVKGLAAQWKATKEISGGTAKSGEESEPAR
jgi:DNA-binding NtrC family response regulator